MVYLYDTFFYQPLLNALVALYNSLAFQDLGLAIIFLTIAIRLILFPLFHKSVRHQVVMQRLQPELKKIQEQHAKDRERQAKAMLELYRAHRINPFSGFLLLLVQLPVLIALYQVFSGILDPQVVAKEVYSFVHAPETLTPSFFGLLNLSEQSIFMVGLAALAQYIQGRMALPALRGGGHSPTDAERMGRNMVYIAPLITLVVFWQFPAAVSLYWAVSSAFSVVQQLIVNRQLAQGGIPPEAGRRE
ncbi:MAG: membrane protein insertase YidC [Candidatus Liptonbacteria bacterium]|nr:membrane protein insertase YidC [Candidatus Liptonbacteria bacterium]